MSLQQRIESIVKRKREEQLDKDFISETNHQQPIKNCTQKLFKLIVKLEDSKARSKKQYPVQVRQRIFIGNYVFASDEDFLTKSNIGLVISCLSASPVKNYKQIQYEKISIKDQEGEDLLQYAETIFDMIENHIQHTVTKIYIHCFHGKSRSPAVLLMYLMKKEQQNLELLLKNLQKVYSLAEPNKWFTDQLNQYKKVLENTMSAQNSSQKPSQQDDLLGFDLQPIKTEQTDFLDILDNVPATASMPDLRQHLLIPQHQKNNSPKKDSQYHLIQIEDEDQNVDLI